MTSPHIREDASRSFASPISRPILRLLRVQQFLELNPADVDTADRHDVDDAEVASRSLERQ
jgi:hypothetical protein